MMHIAPALPWIFDLEGTFLGASGPEREPARGIALEVENERIHIDLPERLHHLLQPHRQPGGRVRCVGRSHLDLQTKTVAFEAYELFFFNSDRELPVRSQPVAAAPAATILLCGKSGCRRRGGRELLAALKQNLTDRGWQNRIAIAYSGCQKHCDCAPSLTFQPGQYRYEGVRPTDLPTLLDKHCAPPAHVAS